jgi:hypothetical protein
MYFRITKCCGLVAKCNSQYLQPTGRKIVISWIETALRARRKLLVEDGSQWPMGNYLNARMRGRGTGPTIASWFSPGKAPQEQFLVVAVNYVPNQSQCHVRLPLADRAGEKWRLQDDSAQPASSGTATICKVRGGFWTWLPGRLRVSHCEA